MYRYVLSTVYDSSDESVLKEMCLIVQAMDAEEGRELDYSNKFSVYVIDSLAKTA